MAKHPKTTQTTPASPFASIVQGKAVLQNRVLRGLLEEHLATRSFSLEDLMEMFEARLDAQITTLAQGRHHPAHAEGVTLQSLQTVKALVAGRSLERAQDRMESWFHELSRLEGEYKESAPGEHALGLLGALQYLDPVRQVRIAVLTATDQDTPQTGSN